MKQTSPAFIQDKKLDGDNHPKAKHYGSFKFECDIEETPVNNDTFNINTDIKNFEQDIKDINLSNFNLDSYERKPNESLDMNCWNDEKINLPLFINNEFNNKIVQHNNQENNNSLNENKLNNSPGDYKSPTIAKVYPLDIRQSNTDNDKLKINKSAVNDSNESCSNNKDLNVTLPTLTRKILTWPPGPWEDGPRRSAFQPYKPATVLTNLQRGNMQAKTPQLDVTQFTWHMKAGRGDLRVEDIINVQDINEKDEYDMTGLMWSAAYGQTTTVQRLLERGSDPKIRGNRHQTALHMAAYGGHHEILKLLVAYGADVNAMDGDGNTPIMYAVYEDHPHAVHELILGEADLCIFNFNNVMPYKLAVERNCTQAKLVIENHMINLLSNGVNG